MANEEKFEDHEFAFDVTLFGVIRIKAPDEAAARAAMLEEVESYDINHEFPETGARLTEISLDTDPSTATVFEKDGVEVERNLSEEAKNRAKG